MYNFGGVRMPYYEQLADLQLQCYSPEGKLLARGP
jgi:hypothetical protein